MTVEYESTSLGGWPARRIEAEIEVTLTDRQLEALLVADETGFYELPRRGTSEDMSRELQVACSAATRRLRGGVGELLSALDEALDGEEMEVRERTHR